MVLLREPRLKSNNRSGALSQPSLKLTPINMLLPPRDSTAKHSTIVELTWRREIAKIEGGGFAL